MLLKEEIKMKKQITYKGILVDYYRYLRPLSTPMTPGDKNRIWGLIILGVVVYILIVILMQCLGR